MSYIGNKEKLRRANQKIVYLKRELKESQEETKQVLDDYQDLGKEKYKLECELEKKDKIIDEILLAFYKKTHISTNCFLQKERGIEYCLQHKTKNCIECLKQYYEKKVEGK